MPWGGGEAADDGPTTETRATRKTRLTNQAHAKRLNQQKLARASGLLRIPLEVQRMIFSYAVDGDGRGIVCVWRPNRVIYYREGWIDLDLVEKEYSQDLPRPASDRELDVLVTDGALKDSDVIKVLPRLKREHISTVGSLCTFTRDVWSTLPVEVNVWKLDQATAIAGFSQDIGKKGQLSLRDLKINVTSRQEALELHQVTLFRHLRTLLIRIPHSVFVHAVQPRWSGLAILLSLAYNLKDLVELTIICEQEHDGCIPFSDLTRKHQYNQWAE